MAKQSIYTVGGTVQASGGLYLPRKVDEELLALCRAGTFAYVLTSRQMGKSSLMVRTAERLAEGGIHAVIIDLNQLGIQLTAAEWYLGLLTIIADSLMLKTDVMSWWQAHAHLGVTQRLTRFFQEILLAEVKNSVVIFVDEIDTTLNLPFTDDFYAAIRYLYNARALVPAYQRLSFVLIGVATPSDLIRDPQRTPFNIGQRVDLTEVKTHLKLSGIVRREQDTLHVRNPIYAEVFDQRWVQEHWPVHWIKRIPPAVFGLIASLLAIVVLLAMFARTQQQLAQQQQEAAEKAETFAKEQQRLRLISLTQALAARALRKQDDRGALLARQAYLFYERSQGHVLDQIDDALRTILSVPHFSHILRGHENRVWSVAFSPDGQTLASGSVDDTIRLWDLRQPAAAPTMLRGHKNWVLSVTFSPDGQTLASGSRDNTIRLWDLRQPAAAPTMLRGHENRVWSVAFSPDGQTLASGSLDNTIRLWDLRQLAAAPVVLRGHENAVYSVAFSPDGQTLASGSGDQTIRIWIVRTEIMAGKICQQVWRNLTLDEWRQFVGADLPYERTCPNLVAGAGVSAEVPEITP